MQHKEICREKKKKKALRGFTSGGKLLYATRGLGDVNAIPYFPDAIGHRACCSELLRKKIFHPTPPPNSALFSALS